jgi:2-polyprenyl-3-methyl-5-hydroxy-6-metoxy-1,4-benzoquinol methylase
MSFEPHRLRWTSEETEHFWDWYSTHTAPGRYFSEMVGDELVRYAAPYLTASTRVLDFGCGPGYLMSRLLEEGLDVEGVDFSQRSVDLARERLAARGLSANVSNIDSLPTDLPSSSIDMVFLVETVEHLTDEHLESTLAEVLRLLVPGGVLLVTTPNQEDLAAAETMCPECGAIYHAVQHVRSWTPRELQARLNSSGFATVTVETLDLHRQQALRRMGPVRRLASRLKSRLAATGDSAGDGGAPNLVAVVRRP